MEVALKIWRVDENGERDLKTYEVEAPEWACLLDVLDIIKDRHDGTLAYRKSCRMMICGSCGMRMDGRAILACKERMKPIVDGGHVPVISSMGNMPIIKDLVVEMAPFWKKIRDVKPWLDAGYDEAAEKERVVSQQQMNVIAKESLCIMCGCCVSECNAMEADPDFRGPAALAKGMRFVGDPRDNIEVERLNELNDEHGIWDCTRCYFCNERCPKGVDPRDAIAKLGAESVKHDINWDLGAKHAKWFVTSTKTSGWLRETELVPKTQGIFGALKETKFALALARRGKVPPPGPIHVAADVDEARALYNLVKEQGRDGAAGIVQGERGARAIERRRGGRAAKADRQRKAHEGRLLQRLPGVAVGEGARHLDAGARAQARDRAGRAGIGHLLRGRRHPRGRARLLPAPERADSRLRRANRRRHADDDLQRLHAQPTPGGLAAQERRRAA